MSWSLRGINGLVIEDRPNFQLRNSLKVVYYQRCNLLASYICNETEKKKFNKV